MHNPASVGVVIPAYNAADTIERALRSIAAQTLKPAQVVVVDDGSVDQTETIALACGAFLDGVALKVVRQENVGAGAARNRGISEVDQPYVAFLDSDDEWFPKKLERSMAVLKYGDFDLVAHDFVAYQDGVDRVVEASRYFGRTEQPLAELYIRGYIPSITVVVRRDLITSVSGFDVTLPNAQDFDLWLAMLLQPGIRFTVFDEPLARYRQGPTGIMSHTERRLSCCIRIARRYAPQFSFRAHTTRIMAVHKEAFVAHVANKKWVVAMLIPIRLSLALIAEPLTAMFMKRSENIREPMIRRSLILGISGVWAFAVFTLYIAQFSNVFGAVLRVIGIQ